MALPLVLCCSLLGFGCSSADDAETETTPDKEMPPAPDVRDVEGGPGCTEAACFFEQRLWEPILTTRCLFCHYAAGPAKASEFVLLDAESLEAREANFATVCAIARTDNEGSSQLLLKPSYQTDHGGGLRVAADSEDFASLEAFVVRAEALDGCRCDACDTN